MISGLHLLRHVPGRSVVHRAGARTKIVALTVVLVAVAVRPGWGAAAVIWSLVAATFAVARLPLGVLPRPPRILLIALAASFGLAVLAGGDPVLEAGGARLPVGGLVVQLRFTAVSIGVFLCALLLGWTTPAADLPPAAGWLLAPLRRLRFPVDEVVAALTLAVRALPLVADELSTMVAVWRTRPRPTGRRSAVVAALDLAATAATTSVRRASELGTAVTNRGPIRPAPAMGSWTTADLGVGVVAGVAVAVILAGP